MPSSLLLLWDDSERFAWLTRVHSEAGLLWALVSRLGLPGRITVLTHLRDVLRRFVRLFAHWF